MESVMEKTNVELLRDRYTKIPRIEETGPQKGFNGRRMTAKAIRWRLLHALACVIGFLPLVLSIAGVKIDQWMIAVGFGLLVPGGGFMAAAGALTMPLGLFICFWLWRKRAMRFLMIHGSVLMIFGLWLLGALGGLLVLIRGMPIDFLFSISPYWWGYILAVVACVVHFGDYELKVRKLYKRMADAREFRIEHFDETIQELEDVMAKYEPDPVRELTEDQLRAERYLLEATVREQGDFSGFDKKGRMLMDNRYQFSVVGMSLMVLQSKYMPNFHGYLKTAREFLINAVTDPRTCGYWAKTSLYGYWKWNPNPINHSNVMLSGWLLPMVTSFEEQFQDDKYEEDGSITFVPFADKAYKYPYSAKGIVEALYKQLHDKIYPYMYIPCEPHLAFPTCNSYGLLGMLIYDRIHNTHYMADIFDDLYDNLSSEFTEVEGTMALCRQYIFGLRHLPASQLGMGYDPMADVQNYLHYSILFPGYTKRNYAYVRKHHLEIRDGVTYIKGRKWEEVFDMATQSFNPALTIAMLKITAAEYGDTEVVDGLQKAMDMYLEPSKDPKVLKWKNVPVVVSAWLAFASLQRKGDWADIILRGTPESAKTGPILAECKFPEVMVAKAHSTGDDLDLVLYNGEDPGEQALRIERLRPKAEYSIDSIGFRFTSDDNGAADITVALDGRTPLHIVPVG